MREPRVFVTHAATRRGNGGAEMVHDYSAAEIFGTIHYVTLGRRDWKKPEAYSPFVGLEDFSPRLDYLLPSGDFASIVAATVAVTNIIARLNDAGPIDQPAFIRVLAYSTRDGTYSVVEIPTDL